MQNDNLKIKLPSGTIAPPQNRQWYPLVGRAVPAIYSNGSSRVAASVFGQAMVLSGRASGVVLILVLWTLVIVAVLAVAIAQETKLDNAIRVANGDRVVARWLARSGVHSAIEVIADDRWSTDWVGEKWYDNAEIFSKIEMQGGSFSVSADRLFADGRCAWGLVDEASKLNVNTAEVESLKALPGMTEELALAIVDDRKAVEQSQIDSSTVNDYYGMLGTNDTAVLEDNFGTIRSLASVRGMTREWLYGEDSNLNGVLENNENDGDTIAPADNKDGLLDRGLLSYVTVYSYELNYNSQGHRRININTAGESVLREKLELNPGEVKWILDNRIFPFNSIAELLDDDAEITPADVTSDAAPDVAIKTDTDKPNKQSRKLAVAEPTAEIQPVRIDVGTFRRIADRITATARERIIGRININTAAQAVLITLPDIDERLAASIIAEREKYIGGFSSIAELLGVEGITVRRFKTIARYVTVRSNVFTIRSCSLAKRTGLRHWVEAVVERSPSGISIIYWHENM